MIGWILKIPRLKKGRARNQEVFQVVVFDLQKQLNELEVELRKGRARHLNRDVDNALDVERKGSCGLSNM